MRQSISAAENVLARAKFDPQVPPVQRRAASFIAAPREQSTYLVELLRNLTRDLH